MEAGLTVPAEDDEQETGTRLYLLTRGWMKAEAEAVFEAQPVLDLSHADFSLRQTVS